LKKIFFGLILIQSILLGEEFIVVNKNEKVYSDKYQIDDGEVKEDTTGIVYAYGYISSGKVKIWLKTSDGNSFTVPTKFVVFKNSFSTSNHVTTSSDLKGTNKGYVTFSPEAGKYKIITAMKAEDYAVYLRINDPIVVEEAPPEVTRVSPTTAIAGEKKNFTIYGSNLPTTIVGNIHGSQTHCSYVSGSGSSVTLKCDVPDSSGNKRFYLKEVSGGDVIDGSENIYIQVEDNTPEVTRVSPTTAITGERKNFTIFGSNLPTTIVGNIHGSQTHCSYVSGSGSSVTLKCDVPNSSGSKRFYLKENSGGDVIDGSENIYISVEFNYFTSVWIDKDEGTSGDEFKFSADLYGNLSSGEKVYINFGNKEDGRYEWINQSSPGGHEEVSCSSTSCSITRQINTTGDIIARFGIFQNGVLQGNYSGTIEFKVNEKPEIQYDPEVDIVSSNSPIVKGGTFEIELQIDDENKNLKNVSIYFGDGSEDKKELSGTNQRVSFSHIYKNSGNYTVTVKVHDHTERKTTVYGSVKVKNNYFTDVNVEKDEGISGDEFEFSADLYANLSSEEKVYIGFGSKENGRYEWINQSNPGGHEEVSCSSTSCSITRQINTTGDIIARFGIFKNGVLQGDYSVTIEFKVNEKPEIKYDPEVKVILYDSSIVKGETFEIELQIDDKNENLKNVSIDFGDGSQDKKELNGTNQRVSFSHIYKNSGNYTVTVKVHDHTEKEATISTNVLVKEPPVNAPSTEQLVFIIDDSFHKKQFFTSEVIKTSSTPNSIRLTSESPKDYSLQTEPFTKIWSFSENIENLSISILNSTFSSYENLENNGLAISIDLTPNTSLSENKITLQFIDSNGTIVKVGNSENFWAVVKTEVEKPNYIVEDRDLEFYPDVPNSHKHYKDIAFATQKGIVKGYDSGDFRPDSTPSLAEVLKMIFLSANKSGLIELPKDEEYFYSVFPSWASPYYTFGRNQNAIENYKDLSVIYPTRDEVAKILVLGLNLYSPDGNYSKTSQNYGLLEDGNETVTRGEIVGVISKLFQLPKAEIEPLSVEYGDILTIPTPPDITALQIDDDLSIFDSSDSVVFENSEINSSQLYIARNTLYLTLQNGDVTNFISVVIDVNFTDSDFDGIPDSKDIFPTDSRYSSDENGNGVPDILDLIYDLNSSENNGTTIIGDETVSIEDLIENGGYVRNIFKTLQIPNIWNLVSGNFDLNRIPENILFWKYNENWSVFGTGVYEDKYSNYQTFSSLENSEGVWIKTLSETEIQILPNSENSYSLKQGWNLLGTGVELSASELSCGEMETSFAWIFENGIWKASIENNLESPTFEKIEPNVGFWLLCN
jgi:ribosomal protein L9